MPTFRLDPCPWADPEVHAIFHQAALGEVEKSCPGDDSFTCPLCGVLLLRDVNPQSLINLVLQCEVCGTRGIFPIRTHAASHSGSKPPPYVEAAVFEATPQDVRDDLQAAIEWFGALGVQSEAGRVGAYFRAATRQLEGVNGDGRSEYDAVFQEALEIVEIYRSLRDSKYCDFLRERLRRIVGGPLRITDEKVNEKNNWSSFAARNFAFELEILGQFVAHGVELAPRIDADVPAVLDGRTVVFECKRPIGETSCEKNLKIAQKQLERLYAADKSIRGIVAIDLTKVGQFDLLERRLSRHADLSEKHMSYFRRFVAVHQNFVRKNCEGTGTIGLLLRIKELVSVGSAVPASIPVAATNWFLHPLPLDFRDQQTVQVLAQVFRGYFKRRGHGKRVLEVLRER
jgi:hypothetical protein